MTKKSISRARIQGNLDGLCGVYSIVNSALNLHSPNLNKESTKELFRVLCSALKHEKKLLDALLDGITVRPLGELIDHASDFTDKKYRIRILRRIAFGTASCSLDEFWTKISNHIEKHGPGSVILSLGGKHDHWTCVREISASRIDLIDSDGLKFLARKNCTVGDAKRGRHHTVMPTQTYLLSRS